MSEPKPKRVRVSQSCLASSDKAILVAPTFDDLVNTVEKLIEPRLSGSSIFSGPTFIDHGEVSIILANEYFPLSSAAVRINGFIVDPGSKISVTARFL